MHLTLSQSCDYVGVKSKNTFKKYKIPHMKDPVNPRKKLYNTEDIDRMVLDRDMPKVIPLIPNAVVQVDSDIQSLDITKGQTLFDELMDHYFKGIAPSEANVADISSLTIIYLSLAAIELKIAAVGGVDMDLATLHAKTLSNKNLILKGLPNVFDEK